MSDNQDDDLVTSRRSFMATSAAPLLFGIGDDNDLGFFETHKVLDQQGDKATNYGIDPEVLAFGRGLSVADREDGGVRIQNTGAGAVESLDELPNVDVTALWQGPIADRPSASDAPDGARYEATDQNLLYRNDPDNGWVVTNHGTESDPVPEGHYGSLDTEYASNNRQRTDYSDGYPYQPNQEMPFHGPDINPLPNKPGPIIDLSHVSDSGVTNPEFVADPFLLYYPENEANNDPPYFLFYEIADRGNNESSIGYSSAHELSNWTFQGDLLDVSNTIDQNYPFTFRSEFHDGRIFQAEFNSDLTDGVALHELTVNGSTISTSVVADPLIEPASIASVNDPNIYYWDGRWWITISDAASSPPQTYAYYTDDLLNGSWTAHDNNPILADAKHGKNGGRQIAFGSDPRDGDGWLWQPTRGQDADGDENVYAISITELTPSSFEYHEVANSPVLQPNGGNLKWPSQDMHHVDVVRGQYAIVDGKNPALSDTDWCIGLYKFGGRPPVSKHIRQEGDDRRYHNFPADTEKTLDSVTSFNGASGIYENTRLDKSVSTSDTTILQGQTEDGDITDLIGGLAVVVGQGGSGDYFTDLVLLTGAGGGTTVVGSQERSSPAARSYSMSSDELQLSMGSGTYNVGARLLGFELAKP